jgi:hypothetical protein
MNEVGESSVRVSSGIILPDGFARDDEPTERTERQHPRHGYVVAVYFGTQKLDEDQVQHYLIEIYEQYNAWGDENSLSYHYTPHDLTTGRTMAVKTIGSIHFDPNDMDVPPFIDMVIGDPARERGKPIGWRRIR